MELNNHSYERYSRQISLKKFGEPSQLKLLNAKVLVIGAGGLGCPVLQYLAAAGIGTIGIVDDDTVTLSNLHRQILFTPKDIGQSNSICAAWVLEKMNPEININSFNFRLTNANVLEIIRNYDIVVDCTDNFASRYMLNDACVLEKKPLVYGSVYQFEGQVSVFNVLDAQNKPSANYRDLFPHPPAPHEVPDCNEAGVIGVLPGIIGLMMANECIKLITGIGTCLTNKLVIYNSLNNQLFETMITAKEESSGLMPDNEKAFKEWEYNFACSNETSYKDIGVEEFNQLMKEEDTIVIDVREEGERPVVTAFKHIRIPMSKLAKEKPSISQHNILLFCHSGIRSANAASLFSNGRNKVYNLKGGIIKWMAYQQD